MCSKAGQLTSADSSHIYNTLLICNGRFGTVTYGSPDAVDLTMTVRRTNVDPELLDYCEVLDTPVACKLAWVNIYIAIWISSHLAVTEPLQEMISHRPTVSSEQGSCIEAQVRHR